MRLDTGRTSQKLRTRKALLAAARALMSRGEQVTVFAAAAEAGISRATAYRYFTAPETLAMEAALDSDIAEPEEVVGEETNLRERVRRVHSHLAEAVRRNEPAFRLFLARALEASARGDAAMLRGGRRLPMYELALAPLRPRMPPEEFAVLVQALSAATGLEAWLALRDVCRLDPEAADRVTRITLEALLDALLPEE